MDCASNYTALIQLAVTFSFVFVVLRQESVNLAGEVISAIFKNMREKTEKTVSNNLSFMPPESLGSCAQDRRQSIQKEFQSVWSSFRIFLKLIHWKPIYMSSWCLICGLYSLVLLFLYAELSENVGFQIFFQSFVILSTFFNLYFLLLEAVQLLNKINDEAFEQLYGRHLLLFLLILLFSFMSVLKFEEPCGFISDRLLFMGSVALSFFPFILVGLLAGTFFLIGKVYEYRLCNKIDDLVIDYQSAVGEAKRNQTFGFGISADHADGLGFGKSV